MINTDRLAAHDRELERSRITKELWRSVGMLGGAGYSAFANCVTQPVFSLKDLDATEYEVMQPVNYPKMAGFLMKCGVKRARRVPYRIAVREGWAAAPTNNYQKTVWEEEKAKTRTPRKTPPGP